METTTTMTMPTTKSTSSSIPRRAADATTIDSSFDTMSSQVLKLIAAVLVTEDDRHLAHLPTRGNLRFFIHKNHQVHRLGNQLLLRRARCLSDEAFKPEQATHCVVRMNRCRSPRMSCIPCFQHGEGFTATNFANHDAGRLQTHTRPQAIEHRHVSDRQERHGVLYRALKLRRVLNDQDP